MQRDSKEYRDLVSQVLDKQAQSNWAIGDAGLKVEPVGENGAHNGSSATLADFAEDISETLAKVQSCRTVSHAWPPRTRVLGASWTTHRILLANKNLIRNGMTAKQAQDAVSATRQGENGAQKPSYTYTPQSEGDDWIPLDDAHPVATEVRDKLGQPVPERLRDVFADLTMTQALKDCEALRRLCKNLGRWNAFLLGQHIKDNLLDVETKLKQAMPRARCPRCKGEGEGCMACRELGWLPEWRLQEVERDGHTDPQYPALAQ